MGNFSLPASRLTRHGAEETQREGTYEGSQSRTSCSSNPNCPSKYCSPAIKCFKTFQPTAGRQRARAHTLERGAERNDERRSGPAI